MQRSISAILFIGLALLCTNPVIAEGVRDPNTYFFNETFGDFSEELQNARDANKKGIMIFFEMDECPFCHWMKVNVLNRPDVQTYYRENFLMFPLDIEGDVEITDFSGNVMSQKDFAFKEFRVRATPMLAFFDLDGKLIHRHTGRTSDADEFMLMGRFIAEGKYKETKFARYKRAQKK
jgi:thioredoxin-related protein